MKDFLYKVELSLQKYIKFFWMLPFGAGIAITLCFSWPTLAGPSLPSNIFDLLTVIVSVFIYLPIAFLFILSVIGIPISFFLYFFGKKHQILMLTFFFIMIVIFVPAGTIVGTKVRHNNFKCLSTRLMPLIGAIESYYNEKGEYPKSLPELVPDFIKSIPTTDMIGYSTYEYHLPGVDSLYRKYELLMFCGSYAFLNSDYFIYWPEKNYPKELWGGRVEQINKWAYVRSSYEDRK